MSSVLEAAKASFKQKMDVDLLSIEVPEWQVNGKPAVIYFRPCMTLKQKGRILDLLNENNAAEMLFTKLHFIALDEEGKRLFSSAARVECLHHIDPEEISVVLSRIDKMQHEISNEEAGKN